ncbi:MAG: hypothetical protein R3C11_04925 [Planctomycetaceae bacterium]
MQPRQVAILLMFALSLGMLTGCSKDQILSWFGGDESTPVSTPGSTKSLIPKSPFFKLAINPEFKTSTCFAKLDTFKSGGSIIRSQD